MPRMRLNLALSAAAATMVLPGAVLAQGVISARPGMLNYVEGTTSLADASGEAAEVTAGRTMLHAGQTLQTTDGRAELLLTPGVYARVGENSALRMVTPELTRTELALEHGRVEIEVDELYKQNDLLVDLGQAQVHLDKRGLYELDADAGTIRTLYGKADVHRDGSAKAIEVKGGRILSLADAEGEAQKFDDKHYSDPLTDWSSLRSEYLGQANQQVASTYATNGFGYAGYGGGFGPGWAWSPGLLGYTWLPGDGLAWSPFGFGFYSAPYLWGGGYVYGPGVYGGGFGTGFYSRPYRRSFANQGSNAGLPGHPVGLGQLGGGQLARGSQPSLATSPRGVVAGGFQGRALPAGGYRGPAAGGFHGGAGLPAGNFHGGGAPGAGWHGGSGPAGGGMRGGGAPAGGSMGHGGGTSGGTGGGHR